MECAQCWECLDATQFTNSQWRKGEGRAKCMACTGVASGGTSYHSDYFACDECDKCFNSKNSLKQHMQKHRPKDVKCPACGERRFGTVADAVAHYEGGYCQTCRDRDQARDNVRALVNYNDPGACVNLLGNGQGNHSHMYQCRPCNREFSMYHSYLRHRQDYHGEFIGGDQYSY
jgi:hypothetical protein